MSCLNTSPVCGTSFKTPFSIHGSFSSPTPLPAVATGRTADAPEPAREKCPSLSACSAICQLAPPSVSPEPTREMAPDCPDPTDTREIWFWLPFGGSSRPQPPPPPRLAPSSSSSSSTSSVEGRRRKSCAASAAEGLREKAEVLAEVGCRLKGASCRVLTGGRLFLLSGGGIWRRRNSGKAAYSRCSI